MDRKSQVEHYFQKKKLLTTTNKSYANHITDLFSWMVQADATDVTATNLSISKEGTASIISKQSGVIAGIEEACYLLRSKTKLTAVPKVTDGAVIAKGDIILTIQGSNRELLSYERVILNILGRMSGIATFTSNHVSIAQKSKNHPQLGATRKTPWMFLDKKAVAVGGGLTHRLNQSDFVLVKDTHLDILKKQAQQSSSEDLLFDVVKRMLATSSFFEIEVKTVSQAHRVFDVFQQSKQKKNGLIFAMMLDNFELKSAQKLVREIKKQTIYKNILIEASGEITEKNLLLWAKTGVDLLSMGVLTHSCPTFNLSMIIPKR